MRMIEPAEVTAERMRQQQLLLAWFSPSFPIGGFAFSHGLEWAHESGTLTTLSDISNWLTDLIEHGSARQDTILLCEAYRAAGAGDGEALASVIELAAALQPSRERQLEATVQGKAFLHVVGAAYPATLPPVDATRITLPIAIGLAGAVHGIALGDLALAFVSSFVANLCSAAVRLGIVGQTDGQRAIAAMQPVVARLAASAGTLTLADLGSAALRSDLFSMQHETQYSRLFRS